MGGITDRTWPKGVGQSWAAWVIGGLLVLSAAACLVKDDERCGVNQTYDEVNEVCACVEGMAAKKDGCVAVVAALGVPCDASKPCTDATYNHCAMGAGGAGYCTKKGCTKHEECEGGYTCTSWDPEPFCKKPPAGEGDACATDADCAGKDATSCDPLSKVCRVAGCTPEPNNCHAGSKCCVIPFGNPMPTVCLAMCPF